MIDLPTVRAGLWAYRAAGRARRQLRAGGLEALDLRPAPALAPHAERGVRGALRARREACLVRAAVRRAWFAGQGVDRALVIGVQAPGGQFAAHAWLEGDPPQTTTGFVEIVRR